MVIFKCKMCGGDLNIAKGVTVCQCEYCDTKQTVPTVDDEKKLTLFSRAHRLRFNCEFDKAAGVYESIIADFPEEAEAYWGLVLCKYGIEYVDDPKTGKKIPTCHRSSFDNVMEDANFELALKCADAAASSVYRDEAKQIEELRRGIIAASSKEEPYDIFICYKETDDKGERTIDSVIAQDVYTALTEKGYRVFFSRISLEDKLGVEYEPYIFAALHSAKVMLAFGTDYEYYNAVWVKNEWSRFLQLIEKGEKKTLIPCYKGIDAYDLPKEFKALQAQDLGKVGAVQDLIRGIGKIIEPPLAHHTKTNNETKTNQYTYTQHTYTAKKELTEKEIFSIVRIVDTMSSLSKQAKGSNSESVRGYIRDLFSDVSNILERHNPNDYKYQWIVFCVYKGFLPYIENYIDEEQITLSYRNAIDLSPDYLKDIFRKEKDKEIPSFDFLTFNQEKLKKGYEDQKNKPKSSQSEYSDTNVEKDNDVSRIVRKNNTRSCIVNIIVILLCIAFIFLIFKTDIIPRVFGGIVSFVLGLIGKAIDGIFGF